MKTFTAFYPYVSPDIGAGRKLHVCLGRKATQQQPATQVTGWQTTVMEVGQAMDPALALDEEQARMLMNVLWDAGFRPACNHGSQGHVASVDAHLQDMRALVATAYKVQLPKAQQLY